jgi:AraC-like DNA-binding protein
VEGIAARRYAQRRDTGNAAILVTVAGENGVPASQCLRDTGIAVSDLNDPHAEITYDQELTLVHNIVAAAPHLGIRAARDVHSTAFGLLGLGLVSSATMRSALAFAQRNFDLAYTVASFGVEERKASVVATFEYPALSPEVERFLFARDATVFVSFFRECLGSNLHPLAVTSRSAPPPDLVGHEAAWGVRPAFGMPRNSVTFESRVLDHAFRMSNPHTAMLCEGLCQELAERRRATDSCAKRVHHVLSVMVAQTQSPLPSEHGVAAALHMSARSLRRELAGEGTSFRQLTNKVLIVFAQQLLLAGSRIDEVATRLGYSDNSSFSRAFKHSTGMSPSAYADTVGLDRAAGSDRVAGSTMATMP